MKILITGAEGFVGKNLTASLETIRDGKDKVHSIPDPSELTIYPYDIHNTIEELEKYCSDCDFVFHLAGVNRPKSEEEYMAGNFGFASVLLNTLKRYHNTCPVMLSSSVQAELTGRYAGSPYGLSKKVGEELFFAYGKQTGSKVLVYRLPNLFGKLCRPHYNSAIATFCFNTAHGLPIEINDPSVHMELVYIDDLIEELLRAQIGRETREGDYCYVPVCYQATLGELAQIISDFPKIRAQLAVPDFSNPLISKLYSTWLSYLPVEKLITDLKMNVDSRGSFTELVRTADRGQFSINVSKPGITKGNHWHHSKNERFVVVSGQGLIQMRKIGLNDSGERFPVKEFRVTGDKMQVVDMIPGFTHNIINLSKNEDLVTFMWANEVFHPERPDTFFEVV